MIKVIVKMLIIISTLCLIEGCAITDEEVVLDYTPKTAKHQSTHPTKPIYVKEFSDTRQESSRLIIHKINENYEDASGRYLSEKPLAAILKRGLEESLERAGYHLEKDADYQLSASIINTHSYGDSGLISYQQYLAIQVEFTLVDKRNKEEVWDQIFTGRGKYSSKENAQQPVKILFIRAADNLFSQLLSNNGFKTVMRK